MFCQFAGVIQMHHTTGRLMLFSVPKHEHLSTTVAHKVPRWLSKKCGDISFYQDSCLQIYKPFSFYTCHFSWPVYPGCDGQQDVKVCIHALEKTTFCLNLTLNGVEKEIEDNPYWPIDLWGSLPSSILDW